MKRSNEARGTMKRIRSFYLLFTLIWMMATCLTVPAVELGGYRLLSVSESEKLILVSQLSDQKKFLLNAADVKITVNGKSVEFKDLSQYAIVQVQMKLSKTKKNGVNLDGIATEIAINIPEPESEK